MDCFQDFCLACDRQCEGSYCSQSCRLADLEKAPASGSISPLTPSSEQQSWESTQSGYVLTPAYNFTERDEKRLSTSSASSAGRSLTPSSSRTSLSSTSSSSVPNNGMSKQARAALQDYFSSFDQTRAAKRRSSLR